MNRPFSRHFEDENIGNIGAHGDRAEVLQVIMVDGEDRNGLFRRFFSTCGAILGTLREPPKTSAGQSRLDSHMVDFTTIQMPLPMGGAATKNIVIRKSEISVVREHERKYGCTLVCATGDRVTIQASLEEVMGQLASPALTFLTITMDNNSNTKPEFATEADIDAELQRWGDGSEIPIERLIAVGRAMCDVCPSRLAERDIEVMREVFNRCEEMIAAK